MILEEISASGANAGACHAQMYTMGTLLRHGSDAQKARVPAADRIRRAAPAGVRRDRAERRLGHDPDQHARRAPRRGLRGQRTEDLDIARRALRPDGAARAHHAAGADREAHGRPVGVPRGHARAHRRRGTGRCALQGAGADDDPPDRHDDEPRHHRGLLREPRAAGGRADRRGGAGLSLHPRRHERRAHPDRQRVHRRLPLLPGSRGRLRERAGRLRPSDRRQPGRAVPARQSAHGAAPRRT